MSNVIVLRLLLLAVLMPATALLGALLELAILVIGVPIAILAGVAVFALDLVGKALALGIRGKASTEITMPDVSSVSVVIPSWNGLDLLQRLLPSLTAALEQHGGDHEIIVVDNGSDDGTTPWLEDSYPNVRIVRLPENAFFGRGIMAGIREAKHDILVLLNNDMVVAPDFLAPLLEGFNRPDVFAVTAQIFFSDGSKAREETGKTRGLFRRGFFELSHQDLIEADERAGHVPVFWAGGGSSAFDRRKLMALGGFDTLYDPFYLEDTDLSYRAWKRGWISLFAPASHVYHEHRGTVRRFPDDYVARVIRSHQYLFQWRNITDARTTAEHFLR